MGAREILLDELIKKGYSESAGVKTWNLTERDLLYMTKNLAEGFLKIRAHERYKKTVVDIEIDLLKKNSTFLTDKIDDAPFNLIDVGCGDGLKAGHFIESLNGNSKIRFCPVSTSEYLINSASKNVEAKELKNVKEYLPRVERFMRINDVANEVRNDEYQKNVILLLGSLLASYDINEYLFNLSNAMLPGDYLIIGNGIRQGERLVNLESYKHEAFENWFIHQMRELGFEDKEVEYDARFANGRVEFFFRVKANKVVESEGRKIEFNIGDEIIVSYMYKFYLDELEGFCKKYFSNVDIFTDPEGEYALAFCKK